MVYTIKGTCYRLLIFDHSNIPGETNQRKFINCAFLWFWWLSENFVFKKSALLHTIPKKGKALLNRKEHEEWIESGKPVLYLQRCPNLTPWNFFSWAHIKSRSYVTREDITEELWNLIRVWTNKLNIKNWRKVWGNTKLRLNFELWNNYGDISKSFTLLQTEHNTAFFCQIFFETLQKYRRQANTFWVFFWDTWYIILFAKGRKMMRRMLRHYC